MKKLVLLILVFSFCLLSVAQTNPNIEDDNTFGKFGKKVVTKSTDEKLNEVYTVEYTDDARTTRARIVWKKGLDGKYTKEEQTFSEKGEPHCSHIYEFDENFKITRYTIKNTNGTDQLFTVDSDGYMIEKGSYSSFYHSAQTVRAYERAFQRQFEKLESSMTAVKVSFKNPCDAPGSTCAQPAARLFAGYSYLTGLGDNGVSFPLGAQVSMVFNLTPRIAIGPDISIHTKKDGDFTFTRMFFLAKGQYSFINRDLRDTAYIPDLSSNPCPRVTPDLHVYLGYGTERSVIRVGNDSYKSSGGGLVFGAGIGVNIRFNNSIGLGIQADYLGTKFKEADEINSDIRGSAGVFFNMGNLAHELKFGR